MKRTYTFIIPLLMFLLASCSGGSGNFVGKWRDVSRESGKVIIIKKQGNSYDMYPEDSPEDFMAFTYDSDRDILTASQGNNIMDIRYDKKTKLLNIAPRGNGWGRKMVLVRAD